MNVKYKDNLSKNVLIWYDKNKRDLPWRKLNHEINPYETWISEIMLQQTTVPHVIKKYSKSVLHRESDLFFDWYLPFFFSKKKKKKIKKKKKKI